ncbi:MAG: tRNA uridine-5-carboxymethylaminomethyl(34) synthesis GTPase MnmE [Proteobacteria bacterium]|nr:tRNA uridine-5-carboxymethylaminomethyl(34) synthesis GTPase MnmE [Pseudomonadota bacterium]
MPSADPSKDTIAAIATPAGRGGIGVVRVSGPEVPGIAAKVVGKLPQSRHATLVEMRNPRGAPIDQGIALYFPGPASYTGEPVLELQGHGGPVVLGSVLAACIDAGARMAEPGEFTRRAFLNGRLDLAQAEGVADLIEAATEEAARGALRSLSGEFSAAVDSLVAQLTELRALTEASLDFPEEEIDPVHREDLQRRLAAVRDALAEVFSRSRKGSLLRSGINIVLAGRPNVGKSSLLNRLAGDDRAIVTPVPGTTRDTLREAIAIEGVPLNIIDTAGLREAGDEVERLGIERTWREVERADIVVVMTDASAGITAEDRAVIARLPTGVRRIHVFNKIDLAGVPPELRAGNPPEIYLSAKADSGVDLLRSALLQAAGWDRSGESSFVARERHLRALALAGARLEAAAGQQHQLELFAEELRLAQEALAGITGEFGADDLLGEIFSRFCIGK